MHNVCINDYIPIFGVLNLKDLLLQYRMKWHGTIYLNLFP